MQKAWYEFLKFWVKLAIKLFYRRIEIQGSEYYPTRGPVVLTPNHQNAFMDALIPSVLAKRPVHFLVRADVFKSSLSRRFFESLNMMPIYRQRDGMANLTKNEQIFDRCFKILQGGGVLLIFPEASHLGGRQLRSLSKGFARIVFGALEKDPELRIKVLPVGLNYSNYADSQSHLILNYGPPLEVAEYAARYTQNPAKAMGDLKDDLRQALEKEMVHIEQQHALKAFDIEMERLLPFFLQRAVGFTKGNAQHGFYKQRETKIQRLAQDDPYFQRLKIYDIVMDRHRLKAPFFFIAQKDPGFWLMQNLLLLLALPVFLSSWLIHAPTYLTIAALLKRYVSDKQFHSSIKLVGSLVLIPTFALLMAIVATLWTGRPLLTILLVFIIFPTTVFIIRELRLPYRYTLTMWRMLNLKFRKPALYRYLKQIEEEAISACEAT